MNRRSSLAAVLATSLAVLLVAVCVVPAGAAKPKTKIKTNPKLEFAMGFSGRLKTGARCKAGRTVNLYSKQQGPDSKQATRKTNKKGRFDFGTEVLPIDGGTFYVRATRSSGERYVCLRGRSNELAFAG